MNKEMDNAGVARNVWLWLTIPISILLALASGAGVFSKDFYWRETVTLKTITEGVDIVILFGFLPTLIVSAVFAWRGSYRAMIVWLGMMGILIYNYGFNALNLHFNAFFLVYVALFGCVLYAFIGSIATINLAEIKISFSEKTPIKVVSIFLAIVAVLFYIVWLREIGSALVAGEVPLSVTNWNVPTSAVHVIDMAVVLPGTIMTADMLWCQKALGYVLSGVMLVIILTMGVGLITGGLWQIQVGVYFRVDILVIFAIISAMALGLLINYLKEIQE